MSDQKRDTSRLLSLTGGLASISLSMSIVGFLFGSAASHQLGASGRGNLAFVLQIAYVVTPFILLGVDKLIMESENPSHLKRDLLTLPTSIGLILLTFISALLLLTQNSRFIWILFGVSIANGIAISEILKIQELRSSRIFGFVTISAGGNLVQLAMLLFLVKTSEGNLFLWILPYLILSLFWLGIGIKNFSREFKLLEKARESIVYVPFDLSFIIVLRSERIWIAILKDESALGLYATASTFIELAFMIVATLIQTLFASRSSLVSTFQNFVRHMVKLNILLLCVGGIAIVLSYNLIIPIFGKEFQSGLNLYVALSVAQIALVNLIAIDTFLLVKIRRFSASIPYIFSASSSILIYPYAVNSFGLLGAAWGSVIVYLIGFMIGVVILLTNRPNERVSS